MINGRDRCFRSTTTRFVRHRSAAEISNKNVLKINIARPRVFRTTITAPSVVFVFRREFYRPYGPPFGSVDVIGKQQCAGKPRGHTRVYIQSIRPTLKNNYQRGVDENGNSSPEREKLFGRGWNYIKECTNFQLMLTVRDIISSLKCIISCPRRYYLYTVYLYGKQCRQSVYARSSADDDHELRLFLNFD